MTLLCIYYILISLGLQKHRNYYPYLSGLAKTSELGKHCSWENTELPVAEGMAVYVIASILICV